MISLVFRKEVPLVPPECVIVRERSNLFIEIYCGGIFFFGDALLL